MIYLVTEQQQLFESSLYTTIKIQESLEIMKDWDIVQFDTETLGRDPHIGKLLMAQFGNKEKTIQIVVDCSTIDIVLYKDILENKHLILQNAKFDLQWLFNYKIIPKSIFDTMIVEQVLYLGYPPAHRDPNYGMSYSLKDIAARRLDIYLDKSVRGEIYYRGIDDSTIKYAADDVVHLYDIAQSQIEDCRKKQCLKAAKLECDFVIVIAYMEWCGIHLDEEKWKAKMEVDKKNLDLALKDLNDYVLNNSKLSKFVVEDPPSLFPEFNTGPRCSINWGSSSQVVPLLKALGFDTTVVDSKTGEEKDSAMEKVLKKQKGIDDHFLKLYLGKGEEGDENYYPGYTGSNKVVTSFGQGHLNAINPNTGRIHTVYRQLGTDTGRLASGSTQNNEDLARLKGLPPHPSPKQKKEGLGCSYPNMQQLPSDAVTRGCFTAMKGNKWCSCDYSAIELANLLCTKIVTLEC